MREKKLLASRRKRYKAMLSASIREFRPAVLFLVKFLGFYLVGSLLYGFYVNAYDPRPDPVTHWVTEQTATALRHTGHDVDVIDHPSKATTAIRFNKRSIVSVYEGCNGINIVIIFAGFLIAFGPWKKSLLLASLVGVVIIHIFNIIRIAGLFLITVYKPGWSYFTHKYLFTAVIYAVVFFLWIAWVKYASIKNATH
jgi:exosortase family protein XrtF